MHTVNEHAVVVVDGVDDVADVIVVESAVDKGPVVAF